MSGGAVWWCLLATLSVGQATEDASFSVNTKTHSHVVSDRFLSITIDPAILMDADYSAGITKVMNLARGLAPAYVRLGSPASNRYQFQRAGSHRQHNASYTITEAQWMILNDFAQKSGLEPIVCVNIMSRQAGTGTWDTRNLRDLVAYSDRRKYKLSWQFGYELQQHKQRFSGTELADDLKTLRGILDTYPRYRQSKILAPDITSTDDPADVEFLKDFFNTAGNALSAVTWHAFEDVSTATRSNEEMNTLAVRENDLADKLGTEFTSKPLWIAESYREPGQPSRFEDGLSWAVKLGEAAKIGVQTVLKRPQINNLHTPTPDYWVSFLHKTLVGELVLANDWTPSGRLRMFSHCTNTRRPATNVFVNDQLRYERGSMTFFGVNRLPTEVDVSLKLGSLTKRGRDVELHEYVLTEDDSQHVGSQVVPKVLLNGRHLSLDFTGRLPILTPKVHHYTNKMVMTLPGSSVGFWVVSGAKARACLFQDDGDSQRRVRRSATAEPASEGSPHNETEALQRKSIAGSQIVMEIGNWKEDSSKTKTGEEIVSSKNNSEKDIPVQSVAIPPSSDGTATEVLQVTDEQLGNHNEENNATHSNHLDEQLKENTERSKYRISKVLVVFENESGDPTNEDNKRALLVDGDTVLSDEKEFNRVSRALEKDAFSVPSIALSLLDMAALKGPLVSLKRLRERRWEQLQRKKLLAGHQYKKALGLQASMLFPKEFIPGEPKRSSMQPNEERRNDYDYVTEEDQPEGEEYTRQYPGRGQWTLVGDLHNGKNVAKPNGGVPAKYQQLWEMETGVIDGPHYQERQRHIRENADGIHMCIKESAREGSPEDTFAYGTRKERVPNKEPSEIIPHYETKLRESTKFQCLDTSKRRSPHEKGLTKLYEGGPKINPTHEGYQQLITSRNEYAAPMLQYMPQVAEYEREVLRASRGKPSHQQEQQRNRRHLTGSTGTAQNHLLGLNDNKAKVTTETLALKHDIDEEHEIKEVSAVTLAVNDNEDEERDGKDVSTVTLAADDKERDRKDISAVTTAADENERDRKEISAAAPVADDKEHNRNDVSAATDGSMVERDVQSGQAGVEVTATVDKQHNRKDVSAATDGSMVERDVESGQAGAEVTATVDKEERDATESDTDMQVNSPHALTNNQDEHLESAVETDKDTKKIRNPILKSHPLIKPIQLPELPLSNLLQRHLDEHTETTLQHYKGLHHKQYQHNQKQHQQHNQKQHQQQQHQQQHKQQNQQQHKKIIHKIQNLVNKNQQQNEQQKVIHHNQKLIHENKSKLVHLLSDIKSRTHQKIEELKKKVVLPKAKAIGHSIIHLKDTLQTEENNLKEKVEGIRDVAVSLKNTDAPSRLHTADETQASGPEKRNSIESTQNLLKERIKKLLDTVSIHPDHEPSLFERRSELEAPEEAKTVDVKQTLTEPNQEQSALERRGELEAPDEAKTVDLQQTLTEPDEEPSALERRGELEAPNEDAKTVDVVQAPTEPDQEDLASEKARRELEGEGEVVTEAPAEESLLSRMRRHANYDVGHFNTRNNENTYPNQHSKKRLLKIKELQLLDSPKEHGNLNHRAKSTDHSRGRNAMLVYDGSTLDCAVTQPNNGYGSSKCASQADTLTLKTLGQGLSQISSGNDESELNYRTKVSSANIALDSSSISYNANSHKQDGHRSKSWHLKNIDSNRNRDMGNLHLIEPYPHNPIDTNKRPKRYIKLFSDEVDSDQFLNQRLSMVDSNSNQDVSKNTLKRDISSGEKMPRFSNLQKLKRAKRVRGDNFNREFKDWNLALSSQGLQIEAETFRNDVDKDNTKYVDGRNHATSLATEWNKVFPSQEPKKMQKRHYSGTDDASQKLGFFGNILKKIYTLFHSIIDKP